MRNGHNPAKVNPELPSYARHRIIIPVFIPSLDGYFESSLSTLRLCFESLRLTTVGKANITVVSNGSAPQVVEELDKYYQQGWIDQLLLSRKNRGKVDAVVSVARGAFEELITISDCDVLFKAGWLEAVETTFHNFPECGFVSPMPTPNTVWRHTSATILGGLVRRELALEKIVPDEDLDRFAHSVGNPNLFQKKHRRSQLIVRRDGATACVGCGHFVCTVRREVLKGMPEHPSQMAIGGNSEELWLDVPSDKVGLWRLATTRAYVYHMGNSSEPWMYAELEQCQLNVEKHTKGVNELLPAKQNWTSRLPWRARQALVRVIAAVGIDKRIFLGSSSN